MKNQLFQTTTKEKKMGGGVWEWCTFFLRDKRWYFLLPLTYWKIIQGRLFLNEMSTELNTNFSVVIRNNVVGWGDGSAGKALVVQERRSEFRSPESVQSWTQPCTSVITAILWEDRGQKQRNPEACGPASLACTAVIQKHVGQLAWHAQL